MQYVIGIDLGTSGTKTVLFDCAGNAVASATQEYPLFQPQNGWAEQNPEDWYQAVIHTLKSVLEQGDVSSDDIAGIGLSGQMHGLVMVDETGDVLRPAILWCDGRTGRECQEITEIIGASSLIEITANPALTGFTAGKILWVRRHEPSIYEKCRQILLPKDYIRYKLTGVFASEMSDASGTNLFDVPRRCWSERILQQLQIDSGLLPSVYESTAMTGTITAKAAALTGLREGTPVAGGAGDNAAAAVGTGVVEAGKAFTTIGTSGVIFAHMDQVSIDPRGRVHTFCHAVPNSWTVMSCTLSAGFSLKWFRDTFCNAEIETASGLGVDPYELLNQQIERLPIGAEKLIYLPYLMGERSPLLDEQARGVFFGLSSIHSKAHLLRAVMEGVSYSQRQCLDILREMGVSPSQMLATGGGAASPVWRQMLADVYNCPIVTIDSKEGPALGAALLAAVGAGIYADVPEACRKTIQTRKAATPIAANTKKYEPFFQLYESLYPALKDQFHMLSVL